VRTSTSATGRWMRGRSVHPRKHDGPTVSATEPARAPRERGSARAAWYRWSVPSCELAVE
jgi:hypothetical protein